ncbi:MAG: hypothetical protein WAK69_19830 [Rhodoplanes sp.]
MLNPMLVNGRTGDPAFYVERNLVDRYPSDLCFVVAPSERMLPRVIGGPARL